MTSRLRLRRQTPKQLPPTEPSEIEEVDDGEAARMGLFDHLNELRIRVFRAAIALVIATIAGIPLATPVLMELQKPYGREFTALGPTDSVVNYFRVVLMIGAIISIPVTTYQLLMFILPGLTRKEKRYLLTALPAITGLFLIGAGFAWFLLVPPALGFLEGFQPTIFKPEWTADLYLSFVTALIFWMGVAFQTPLVFFVLSLLGMVTATALLRQWRIAIVGAAIAAAAITPTIDPVNMALVMGPLLALYGLSIILVAIGRRFSRVDQAATT
ncbi:MAG: twin-arginine translocase subunit TatC [Anaerolineae bacterium]|nr:twin-arginine translocase subunit TatC [Anaerolineae bacterium]